LEPEVYSSNSLLSDTVQVPLSPPHKENDLTLSIVICTRNRPALLEKCLEAVAALDPQPDDVLIVDNSTGCREAEQLARRFSARYLVEPTPGLSRARNRGLDECSADIVAYLDDDATPSQHWIHSILAQFNDPKVAAVTGETILPDADPSKLMSEPPRTLSNQDPKWFEIATFGGLGVGNNMALRKAACNGHAVFDLRLGRSAPIGIAEESYAFAQLLSRGYRAVHVPDAIVVHPVTNGDLEQRATSSVAYWLLLFSEFPGHRMDLLRFLTRRLRRKPLTWPRNPQAPGELIMSGWRVYWRAGVRGVLLYMRSRKLRRSQG
jgi:glycosyltransferase involved in cell wall biosynthesis